MYIFGKIIGGFFGALLAGPVGLMLGVLAGHFFDKGLALNERLRAPDVALAKKVFFKTTFMIMGYIAKADGRVSEQEIYMARNVMNELHLTDEQRINAMNYFNQGKSANFNWLQEIDNFIKNCGYHPQLIQLFVEIQLKSAFVDGISNTDKRRVLERLCEKLNIPRVILSQMESQFYSEKTYRAPRQPSSKDELSSAYALLGVTKDSTNQQIKKAYKVLMSQHHPDKLVAKGLPDEMIKIATEKTQKIQKAYELICQVRGI